MEDQQIKIYQIIARHVQTSANVSDLQEIKQWNELHPQDQVDLDGITYLFEETNDLSNYIEFDHDGAFESLSYSSSKGRAISRKLYILSSAAIFLILIFSALSFWNMHNKPFKSVFGSEQKYVILEDETEVYLKENTNLAWDNDFTENRRVNLHGDAFFHVATLNSKPFVIEMDKFACTVLGTSFSIEQHGEAIIVRMREGKLKIESEDSPGMFWTISAKESAVLKDGRVEMIGLNNDDLLEDFSFQNESMLTILQNIRDRFPDVVQFQPSSIGTNCNLTANFDELTLLEMMKELRLFFDLDYTIQNGRLLIRHLSC